MLWVLLESALRSLLLGGIVWFGLTLLRIRDPRAHMTAWTVVLIASLAMPAMMRVLVVTVPSAPPPLQIVQMIEAVPSSLLAPVAAPADVTAAPVAPLLVEPGPPTAIPSRETALTQGISHPVDWIAIASALYITVAGVLLLRLLLGVVLTWRLARAARPLAGSFAANVRISDVVGVPVTFGSTILLPPAFAQWNPATRQAVLSHERAHVVHGDFYVLLLAAFNRAVFWFSPFAWWQFNRLAELAEMISDDAAIKVLADRPCYARILLDLAGDVPRAPAGLAMARAGTVRQRVERILAVSGLPAPIGWQKQALIAAALVPAAAICAATIAYGVSAQAERQGTDIVADGLDAYVGWYEFNPTRALAVTRNGRRLFAQETGGPKFELVAQEANRFVSADGNAVVVFAGDAHEQASALTVQEPAWSERHAKRIDATRGRAIQDVFARRVAAAPDRFRDQVPAKGSKAAVLQAIDYLQRGIPNYDRMSAPLAERTRKQLPSLTAMMTALGGVESIFFRGVGPGGYDIYGAKFKHGFAELRVLLAADGSIEDLAFRPDGDDTPGGIVACAHEQALKPEPRTAPIKLLLFNISGADVQLFALDQEGKRARRVTVGNNRTVPVMTYVERPWVVADAAGQCLEIVIPGQHTRFLTLRPVDAGAPHGIVATRRSTPLPGSEETLRQYIDSIARGTPDYDRMTPEVAAATRRDLLLSQAIVTKLGAVRAVSFRAVTALDADMYMVYFAGGAAEWRIGVLPDGRISRLSLGPQS